MNYRWIIALALSVAITGCEKKSGDSTAQAGGSTHKFAFVTNNASEFWKIAEAGVRKANNELGTNVEVKMPPNGTVEEQNQILENLVSQGYDGIAISVIAPKDQVEQINRAARKTKVITHDSDAPASERLVYVGTNNFEAGKALGGEIVKLLPSGGKMAVFVGTLAADNARQRLDGIKSAIAGKNIEIVAEREDQTDRNLARTNVENIINAHSDLKLVCGLWSYNGPAIAKAIEGLNKKGQIIAAVFDEEDLTLDGIESGTIAVTVVQKPFEFGYQSTKILHQLATKGPEGLPANKLVDTGVEVINKENVAAFRAKLAEMKK